MISADEMDAVRVAKLEADEEGDGFDTEKPAVYIVAWYKELVDTEHQACAAVSVAMASRGGVLLTKEEIVCIRTETTYPEYLEHIKELPMDISHDSDGRSDVYDIALFHQQLLRFGAYCFDDRVG